MALAKAGPSLRGERRAIIGGSLVNGLETIPSLKYGSSHAGEDAMPNDGLRTVRPMGCLLHQEVVKISQEKMSITLTERGIVGA